MKLIIISSPKKVPNEHKIIKQLFENGLETFHLRKPEMNFQELKKYIDKIPEEHRQKIVVHQHFNLARKFKLKGVHLTEKHKKTFIGTWFRLKWLKYQYPSLHVSRSVHRLQELKNLKTNYNYLLLSPVFNSISKKGYKSAFKEEEIEKALGQTNQKVIALGGINEDNIHKIKEMGFAGAALLGAIWQSNDPVETFIKIKEKIKSLSS